MLNRDKKWQFMTLPFYSYYLVCVAKCNLNLLKDEELPGKFILIQPHGSGIFFSYLFS